MVLGVSGQKRSGVVHPLNKSVHGIFKSLDSGRNHAAMLILALGHRGNLNSALRNTEVESLGTILHLNI